VRATERLTFAFDGHFQGAYRLIPAEPPEAVGEFAVSEGATR
jgi:hypothetical protein